MNNIECGTTTLGQIPIYLWEMNTIDSPLVIYNILDNSTTKQCKIVPRNLNSVRLTA
jgi:hypothetical protein